MDNVSITGKNGNNIITQLDDNDIEHSYYNWYYDETTGNWQQSDTLTIVSDPNTIAIGMGEGNNTITLSDVAQDYQLNFGEGDNTITIGHENSDSNYVMNSSISMGDGDNQVRIVSGDGTLKITGGSGNNSISFSSDIDNATINVGNGDNTIVQTVVEETDDFGNNTNITLGIGSNTVTLGYGNDSVQLSNDAYTGLYSGAIGQADSIDSGAGSNYVDIKSDADHTVSMGDANYQNLSTYQGYDYNELYLGNGNNTVNIKGSDEIYAEIGGGNNTVNIANTQLSSLFFDAGDNFVRVETLGDSYLNITDSGNTNVSMGAGSTLLTLNNNVSNTISTGAGNDDVYTYNSDDTYHVNIGDGSDAILDMYGTEKVVFGTGITKDTLKVRIEFHNELMNHTDNVALAETFRNYNSDFDFNSLTNANLVIQYSDNPSDVLILANWYDRDKRIESFVFSDGTTLSDHQIVSLIGTAQDDLVLGTEGNNTLHGGEGEDEIDGGEGNDTYLYNRGDSYDTFNEDGGFDTIAFGENITKNDLILQQVDNNLLISLKEDGKTLNDLSDTIIVNNWFDESGRIERFTFSDGTSMELDEMLSLVDTDGIIYYGTPNEDSMEGSDNGDIIMALESNDIVNGNGGNDLLFGEAGDDVLDGGEGDDLLSGGEGNDTYIIGRNEGNDRIFDSSGTDTVQFVAGITADDLTVWYENNDLMIGIEGTTTRLTDWYNSDNRIELFAFNDGTTLNINDIINLQSGEVKGVSEGTTFNVDGSNQTIYYGQNGNDTYRIGTYAGDNTIFDLAGADKIEFISGITQDMLTFSYEGDDLIIAAEGTNIRLNGWYTIQNRIETFGFEDGTTLNAQNIINLMSTDEGNIIRSLEEGPTIDAGEGDDILQGSSGRDTLIGGLGADIYRFGYGSGHDVIMDSLGVVGEIDSICFDKGISSKNILFKWEQPTDNLIVYLRDPNQPTDILDAIQDRIVIQNWYQTASRIETFVFDDGTVIDTQGVLDRLATDQNDLVRGMNDENTVLNGLDGNDELYTFGGNDTLIGGNGNDLLAGGAGNDTYIFNRGDGVDSIIDRATYVWNTRNENDSGNDQIRFGENITIDNLTMQWDKDSNDLIIGIKDPKNPAITFDELSNKIIIREWFNPSSRIESIAFADGSQIGIAEIYNLLATDGDDDLRALDEGGILNGYKGNDRLEGSIGDDILIGGDGNDRLFGQEGDDTLDGGSGNDTLEGGSGNDSYIFGYESGKTIVYDSAYILDINSSREDDYVAIDGGIDTIYFGEGITADDLSLSNDGYDLVITLKNSTVDELRIQDYYKPFNTIEYFGFSDGTMMSNTEFEMLIFTSKDDDVTFVDDQNRILYGDSGNDIINGGSGNDIIDGEGGDDILNGGFGDDTYLFGRGSGHDTITDSGIGEWWQTQSGNDKVVFKDGLTANDLVIRTVGNDVIIGIKEKGKTFDELSDILTIKGALEGTTRFESVAFDNGTVSELAVLTSNNHAPEALSEVTNTLQDIRVLTGAVGATDVDGDVLFYSISTLATHGTLSIDANGIWTYNAQEGYIGADNAIITIDDGNGGTVTQTLHFDMKVSAPTLTNASASLLEDTPASGALNVINPIGGALTYEVINASTKGAFGVDATGKWDYTPNANLNGSDAITLKVTNSYGLSTTATLNLSIEAVNDAPVITAPLALNAVAEDSGSITITTEQLLAHAFDVDGDTLKVINLASSAGVLIDNNNGTWSLTPTANYNGSILLNYNVTDGKVNVATTATQVITPVNDAPVILETPAKVTLNAGSVTQGTIKASDVDGDTLKYTVSTAPAHGTLAINDQGKWNYTAERYYAGDSSAIVSINDGHGGSVVSTLNFTNLMTPDWQYTYSNQPLSINDNDGIDTLMMNTTSMANLTFLQEGNKLRIDVKDQPDVILTDYFTSPIKGVESIQTAEGSINLSKEKIGTSGSFFGIGWGSNKGDLLVGNKGPNLLCSDAGNDIIFGNSGSDLLSGDTGNDLLIGGDGSDMLFGGDNDDILYGDNGDDYLSGDAGNDKLFGAQGNDTLYGGDGNDLLNGGEGTNYLNGGNGNDTYLFTNVANTTTIDDNGSGSNDTINFGAGITKSNISFLMQGNDLLIQYGQNETITVLNQKSKNNQIEKLSLNDGSYLTNTDVDRIVQQLSAYGKDHGFHINNNTQIQNNQAMMNIVAGGWHTA